MRSFVFGLPVALAIACSGSTASISANDAGPGDGSPGDATMGVEAGPSDAGDGPGNTDAPACGPGEHLCSGTCYPNDISHCGPSCTACGAPMNGMATCDGMQCGFTCDVMRCGMACTNPMIDPKNCGACGHDCLGGQCASGICQPQVIATMSPMTPPSFIAVDANNVYWTTIGSQVGQATIQGGIITVLSSNASNAGWIRVDTTSVYWTQPSGGVMKTAIGSTNVSPLVASNTLLYELRIDVSNAYYVDGNTGAVYTVPLTGGTPAVFAAPSPGVGPYAFDKTNLYWTVYDGSSSTIVYQQALAADGGARMALSGSLPGEGFDVQVDGTTVFFVLAQGGIYSVPIGGNKPTMLTTSYAANIWLDGNDIYWADQQAYKVLKMAKTGGAATVLAYDPMTVPRYVATDATYVYWSGGSQMQGAILRTPK